MRKLIIGSLVILSMQQTSHAVYEQSRNPDRFISLGLTAETYRTSGELTSVSAPSAPLTLVERGHQSDDYVGLGVNLRIPATESLTVDFNYMAIDGESAFERNNNIVRQTSNLDGYRASIGARLYFNK